MAIRAADVMNAPTCIGLRPLKLYRTKEITVSLSDEIAKLEATVEQMVERNVSLRIFLLRLTDPEDLGHAVSSEVRRLALEMATNQGKASNK